MESLFANFAFLYINDVCQTDFFLDQNVGKVAGYVFISDFPYSVLSARVSNQLYRRKFE